MSEARSDRSSGTVKRNLPSWISSWENESNSRRKKLGDAIDEDPDHAKGRNDSRSRENAQTNSQFSKLLEGVVFVLSGFVNPERSTLRSQALDMGAEYQQDWTSDSTLLVCAFPNTPKFRQVESDNGTIVSKGWISECYNQKKLVDIERFLMHAGKPWRKNSNQLEGKKGLIDALHEEPRKRPEKKSPEIPTGSARAKGGPSNAAKHHFSPSKIKEWAVDDLNKTVSWLESQEEKPEASEVKAIAAEGIITCLLDAIESLKENKDIRLVMEQWMFIPHVVKELAELESGRSKRSSLAKEEIFELAITCKRIYESELQKLDSSPRSKRKQKIGSDEEDNVNEQVSHDDEGFDSDRTIEMTEEEIEVACKELRS